MAAADEHAKEHEQLQEVFESQSDDEIIKVMLSSLPKQKGWNKPLLYQYKGFWLYPDRFPGLLLRHRNFIPRDSDLFLATSQKVGTTWLKALAFSIVNRNQYSFSQHPLLHANPHGLIKNFEINDYTHNQLTDFSSLPSPRLIQTHFPFTLLPDSVKSQSNCKIVYMCRNPKDTFVSSWKFFGKLRPKEMGDLPLEEAFEMFCGGASPYGPYWDHVLGYWKASQENPNKVMFMKYEEMQGNQEVEVKTLAEFLGFPFTDEEVSEGVVEEVTKLCSFQSLSSMEVNKMGTTAGVVSNNLFFRQGKVGDWAKHLTCEMAERLDEITNQKLGSSGLTLYR